MKANLEVPFGVSEGRLVPAQDANRTADYTCPGCNGDLIYRHGRERRRHFAHKNHECAPETILHKTAKRLIRQVLLDHLYRNGPAVTIHKTCSVCKIPYDASIPSHAYDDVQEEVRVGNFLCDVSVNREEQRALIIEVFVTHRSEDKKVAELPQPWIEVDAQKIIEDPYVLVPIASKIRETVCPDCKVDISEVQKLCGDVGLKPGDYSALVLKSGKSLGAAAVDCWKCHKRTPVFWWESIPFAPSPPDPRPRTIKFIYSKSFGGEYWANTCMHCGMLQGDNFLYLSEESVFDGFPMRPGWRQDTNTPSAVELFSSILDRNLPKNR